MGEVSDKYRRILRDDSNTDRLQYFSDAVFAIALTLLVLEIALPEIEDPTNLAINEGLLDLWPKFLEYALSFGVIAIAAQRLPRFTSPVIMYAGIVSAISLVQFWLWSYAFRKRFLDERIDLPIYRKVRGDLLVVPIIFLVSIPIALLPFDGAGYAAMYVWVASWPASVVVGRVLDRASDNERTEHPEPPLSA